MKDKEYKVVLKDGTIHTPHALEVDEFEAHLGYAFCDENFDVSWNWENIPRDEIENIEGLED